MSKPLPKNYIQLGTLGKTYQLEGGLRFYPLGDAEAEAIFELERVFLSDLGESDVRKVKQVGKYTVIYFTRALSVEAARQLVNQAVYADAELLPVPENDELYVSDLLGQTVFLDGEAYGEVEEIQEASLQDLLIIRTSDQTVMVPLQAPYVEVTDDGIYLEDVPEGLLEA